MIDSIAAMTFDLAAAGVGKAPAAGAAGQVSVHDVARFESQFRAPSADSPTASPAVQSSEGFQSVLKTLESLNGRVEALGTEAFDFAADRQEMTPGDMLMLTVRCHQFMFHCELTANVANRTSEGVQQLFRQQG